MSKKNEKIEEDSFSEINCGYIAPISEIAGLNSEYWSKIKNIIQEVIIELNEELKINKQKLNFRMVSDNEGTDIIQESIVKSLYHDKVVICNISYRNPNVLFELGMRIAFNKSVIMIFDNIDKCPFDVSGIRYITYDKNLDYYDIVQFKKSLKIKIKDVLDTKEEGNPYLRVLKDEILFKVTPKEKEISETDKILLDKVNRMQRSLFNLEVQSLKESINNEFEIPDLNFYKSLNNNLRLRKLLDLEEVNEVVFIEEAILILKETTNLLNVFPEPILRLKLKGYYNYYCKYVRY